ncbi:MAG: hypothetical protein IKZ19_06400, partial [Clostridia bacterium]|nr:hypothetical protein [Clostridia bacterium]
SAAAGLGKAKAFWNHQHCWWFSLTKENEFRTAKLYRNTFSLFTITYYFQKNSSTKGEKSEK